MPVRLIAFAILVAAWTAGCSGRSGPGAPPPVAGPAGETRVTLLQTTDIHDHAKGAGPVSEAPSAVGGYARIAAYVEQVRASCGHPVLLVDSGDWSMGTLYDLTLGRRPLPLWFADALRYDCITLGNHEFGDGPAALAGILRAARQSFGLRTPIVASNLELNGDADLAPFLGPGRPVRKTVVATLPNGLRVGFLGLMGKDAASFAPVAAPVRFTDYGRDYGRVQALVDQLRDGQGCRLVIALDHAGTVAAGAEGEDVDLARNVTGIDVIASGHTHHPLASARTVANGAWTTLICCAGAFGDHVSRLDLRVPPSGPLILEASANPAMTDAVLAALDPPARPDPAFAFIVAAADLELNRALAPVFTQVARFPDYAGGDPARGIYHPVAVSTQDLPAADLVAVPGPNGLGDLCADAARTVANGLPGADRTPFTAAVVATGELRGGLASGAPITFADLYGVLPLGLSPDPVQDGTTGEPLVSCYVDEAALRSLCAMQLVAQTGLFNDGYVNLSGFSYALEPRETAAFFAGAGAAAALGAIRQRAAEGSAPAGQALAALAGLPRDGGAALLAAMAAGNPYAEALVRLADPDPARIAEHLSLLARVADAAEQDDASGSTRLDALLMAQALAAIGPLGAFAPDDPACTGPAAALGGGRRRIALDLYLLMMIETVQARFGINVPVYQAAQGDGRLNGTPDGLRAALANRLDLDPGGAFQEVKAWMALLLYLTTPPAQGGHFAGGRITAEYAYSGDFSQFPAFGAAVRNRNASYPLESIRALTAMVETLRAGP